LYFFSMPKKNVTIFGEMHRLLCFEI